MKIAVILSAAMLVAAAMLHSGCANPINAHTARTYYDAGVRAERGGDLALARTNYSRAYGNAQLGSLGPAAEASYLYEYARVCGHAGDYAESEKSFSEVLTLLDKAKGEGDKLRAPTLAEYSRLLHDTGQHAKAIPIYERAVVELEKHGIEASDPLGFAGLLDDYALSLKAAGLADRAAATAARATALREKHKGRPIGFQGKRYKE